VTDEQTRIYLDALGDIADSWGDNGNPGGRTFDAAGHQFCVDRAAEALEAALSEKGHD
jgi:hypothetical protein